jgi:L-aspartate oxidase
MVQAMRRREESRGGHFRTDFPAAAPQFARRLTMTLEEARRLSGAGLSRRESRR